LSDIHKDGYIFRQCTEEPTRYKFVGNDGSQYYYDTNLNLMEFNRTYSSYENGNTVNKIAIGLIVAVKTPDSRYRARLLSGDRPQWLQWPDDKGYCSLPHELQSFLVAMHELITNKAFS